MNAPRGCATSTREIGSPGFSGKNLHTGRERIPGWHTGQSAIAGVTGIDVVAGVLDLGEIGSSNRHFHWVLTDKPHLISFILKYQAHGTGWRRLMTAIVHRHVLTSS